MVIRCNEKWVIKRSNFHWGPFQPSWRLICCISSYTSAGAMHQRIPVHVQSQSGQIAKQRRRPFNQGDSWLKPIEIPSHAKKCIEMPSFGSICNWACFEVLGQIKVKDLTGTSWISLLHGLWCFGALTQFLKGLAKILQHLVTGWRNMTEKHDFPSSGVSCWMCFLYLLIPLMVSLMLRLITTCVSLLSGIPEMPYNQET